MLRQGIWRWLKPWSRRESPPPRVTLYTRAGCHLCEPARNLLREKAALEEIELREIDVDQDPEAHAQYGDKVPVVELGGRARLWGCINLVLLRRLLRGEASVPQVSAAPDAREACDPARRPLK